MKRFLSEPVAASAYFVYKYRDKHKGAPFNGHVLVCDYGGGTLDLSLSLVEAEKITILERTGKGHDDNTFGRAGIAFDEAVVTQVYKRNTGKTINRTDPIFPKLMTEFEESKIDHKEDVDKALKQHIRESSLDKKVFKVHDMVFLASDLTGAFEQVIKPDLLKALNEMKGYFHAHNVNQFDENRFRVVMAGGFSSFYLVDRTVKDFFGSKTDKDGRFDSCFTVEDTALAISKGAALVANDKINIESTCPVSMGIQVRQKDRQGIMEDKFTDRVVLKKGVKLSDYTKPVFLPRPVEIGDPAKSKIVVFVGDENRHYIRLEHNTDQLFHNVHNTSNHWKIGFSVDENSLFTFHTVDSSGNAKDTLLGDLLEKVSGLITTKEDV